MAGIDNPEEFSRETKAFVWWDITWRLLLIIVGIPAVWMPPVGDQRDTHQGELLLAPGFELRIIKIVRSGDIPVIEVEVREP